MGSTVLRAVEDRKTIERLQEKLEKILFGEADRKIGCFIGYRGGGTKAKVHWSSHLGIWMYSKRLKSDSASSVRTDRFWNAFGTSEPAEGRGLSITCEINFPASGINRSIAGAFATDGDGSTYITHRGRIGGGRKGIGKTLFMKRYERQWADMADGDREARVALIGEMGSPQLPLQIAAFVHSVGHIKKLVSVSGIEPRKAEPKSDFSSGFSGLKEYEVSKKISAQCNHQVIVRALADQLQKRGFAVRYDLNRDLFVIGEDRHPAVLFEIKTDITSGSIYTAIGQLLYHSAPLQPRPRLVVVLPNERPQALRMIEKRLKTLGVETLAYNLRGREVAFRESLHGLGNQATLRRA